MPLRLALPARVRWGWIAVILTAWTQAGLLAATPVDPPPANLAAYGFVSVAAREKGAPRTLAPELATATNATPVTLAPDSVLLLEWQHPRPVREVELTFATAAPGPDALQVEWWHRVWPDNGEGGWMKLDDPFNGDWVAARGNATVEGDVYRFRFAPLDAAELPGLKTPGAGHRQTYKLRVACAREAQMLRVAARSDAVLRSTRLRFEWGLKAARSVTGTPRFEVRNGTLQSVRTEDAQSAVVEVEYADAPDRLSPDRGLVVFRGGSERGFSVFVDDVQRQGALLVRDLGVFVSDARRNLRFVNWSGPSGDLWKEGTVTEQVARMPEQTFERAASAFPAKPPVHAFLGAPGLRQEIALEPQGDIVLFADSLRSPGPDAAASPWRRWESLRLQFGTGEHPVMGPEDRRRVVRSLEDGWLPVIRHAWTDGELAWEQTSVATPLKTNLAGLNTTTGVEPLVLATRFAVTNTSSVPRTAWLWLEFNHPLPLMLGAEGTLLLNAPSDGQPRPGLVPVRGRFQTRGRGELDLGVLAPGGPGSHNPALRHSDSAREAVRYRLPLAPGEGHALDFFLPYIELLDVTEMAALRGLDYAEIHPAAVAYWRERVGRGMTLETPEPWLNDFFRANLWRVLISTDVDPVTGQHQHGAATHHYKNFLNETMMVARSLDLRGEHGAARDLIATFLANQGVKGLPGNFRSTSGVLYAAHPEEPDPYTAQGYNLHHGWGLWAAAEHYRWTRDLAYLEAVAAQLARGADWITTERRATQFQLPGGARPVEWGLLPAGDLEDVEEYLYWYATSAYHHRGLREVASVFELASRRPGLDAVRVRRFRDEAARIGADAAAFAADIRASLEESVVLSPVVPLRDGTWIPYVPPRAYALTDRKEGWIREALYPALHLVAGGVLDERHPYVDWMVQELEDNLFLSRESGYGVTNARATFFDHGGFTLQPALLDLALVHLACDRVPNFLRAFYNTAAVSLYPDTLCFAEWVPAFGRGGGPLYKTPDECKFVQWLRQMLICERGDALELGLGVPRAWMADGQRIRVGRAATWFGRLDLEITSHAAAGRAGAVIRLQRGDPPRAVRLRLRHPGGRPLRSATVNGRPAVVNAARQLIELPAGAEAWEVVAVFE